MATASALRKKSEIFVVVGIGGSYLGARAVIEALQNHFAPLADEKPLIVYAGHNMSEDYLHELMAILDKKDYSLAVISKSGTTTEPAIAFRILASRPRILICVTIIHRQIRRDGLLYAFSVTYFSSLLFQK